MKTSNYKENFYQQIVEFGRSRPWLPLVGIIYALMATVTLTQFNSILIPELNLSTIHFTLSLSALLVLVVIGFYLLSNHYETIWGFSFLLYAFSFLGIFLRMFDLPLTDINNPLIFHIWLLPLVLVTAGVWIGTSRLYLEDKMVNYLPALLILLAGESWFLVGLFILNNVTLTISGFLYGLFIPVAIFFIYSWLRFAKTSTYISPWFLVIGFLLMALTYLFWNPWMSSGQLYNIFFILFNISLLIIFGGFFTLSKDLTKDLESS
ncbi:MAG: hypothetical protein ACFFAE_06330 [Candidatus Hodarchaeota archaeon]